MKFYRWLYLVSAAIILTACGGPVADAPAAVAESDPLVDELIAGAETPGVDLSVLHKGKYGYRYIKVGKEVVGEAPAGAEYKFVLACKYGKKYYSVGYKKLHVGKYVEFKVPDYFKECFALEYGTVGDKVKFDVYQSHDYNWGKTYHTYKGSYEKPGYSHKYGRVAVSKGFHLYKKYVKIIVTNEFKPKKEELEIVLKKEFRFGYEGPQPKDLAGYKLTLTLTCGGVKVAETNSTHLVVKVPADKVRGKRCELKEYFEDDKYAAVGYSVAYEDGVKSPSDSQTDANPTYNSCSNNVCEFSGFDVSVNATKLSIFAINNVKELLELTLKKEFRLQSDHDKIVEVTPHYLELQFICDGKVVAETNSVDYSNKVYADDVRGKHCELTEKISDNDYRTVGYSVAYEDGVKSPSDSQTDANPTFNGCTTTSDYDYCEYSRFDVSSNATKLNILARDFVESKNAYPHSNG